MLMFVTFVALGGECFLWLSQREFAGAPLLVLEAGSNFQQSIEHLSTFGTARAELGVGLFVHVLQAVKLICDV